MLEREKNDAGVSSNKDRRVYPRVDIQSFARVELDRDNTGTVLDISEGGVAIQTAAALVDCSPVNLRFRLPNSEKWIDVSGKLIWKRTRVGKAGVQFIDLIDAQLPWSLQQWLRFKVGSISRP